MGKRMEIKPEGRESAGIGLVHHARGGTLADRKHWGLIIMFLNRV